MTQLSDKIKKLGLRCRHHDPRNGLMCGKDCKIGINIRYKVIEANGGTNYGIAFKMPCYPGPERLVECDKYDPFTDEEIKAQAAEFEAKAASIANGMERLNQIRESMIKNNQHRVVESCVHCKGSNMIVMCAIDHNQHLRVRCTDCGFGFIE